MLKTHFSRVILAIAVSLIWASEFPSQIQDEPRLNATDIGKAAVRVAGIDFDSAGDADLMPLKKVIGRSRIVVLGEATHGEGTTTRAKSRLVRFLHEKMGFEVLVWESGMFSAYAMNDELRDPARPMIDVRKWLSTWGREEAATPLMDYCRASWTTDSPLIMAGLDRSRNPGSPGFFIGHFRKLSGRVPEFSLTEDEWKTFNTFASRAFSLQRPKDQLPSEKVRASERLLIETVIQRLGVARQKRAGRVTPFEFDFAERFLRDALNGEQFNYLAATDFPAANKFRDQMMAENLVWLLDKMYPRKKVIVWAATSHFVRNSTGIRNTKEGWDHPDWYAGNVLPRAIQKRIYTIAFTTHSGKYGVILPDPRIPPQLDTDNGAPPGSFESAAKEVGERYLFVDLKNVSRKSPLRGPFISLALGRDTNLAVWRNSIDAFFYIDRAEPRKFIW